MKGGPSIEFFVKSLPQALAADAGCCVSDPGPALARCPQTGTQTAGPLDRAFRKSQGQLCGRMSPSLPVSDDFLSLDRRFPFPAVLADVLSTELEPVSQQVCVSWESHSLSAGATGGLHPAGWAGWAYHCQGEQTGDRAHMALPPAALSLWPFRE